MVDKLIMYKFNKFIRTQLDMATSISKPSSLVVMRPVGVGNYLPYQISTLTLHNPIFVYQFQVSCRPPTAEECPTNGKFLLKKDVSNADSGITWNENIGLPQLFNIAICVFAVFVVRNAIFLFKLRAEAIFTYFWSLSIKF